LVSILQGGDGKEREKLGYLPTSGVTGLGIVMMPNNKVLNPLPSLGSAEGRHRL